MWLEQSRTENEPFEQRLISQPSIHFPCSLVLLPPLTRCLAKKVTFLSFSTDKCGHRNNCWSSGLEQNYPYVHRQCVCHEHILHPLA